MYNKIFTKILDSSIWMEPLATRIVWLTFIAAMDEHGFVSFASPANVAHRAIVPLDDTVKALAALEGPDANSSDPENEGRRLERVPGGWLVLNAHKYRALVTKAIIQDQTRDRVRAHRARALGNASVTQPNDFVTPSVAVAVAESKNTFTKVAKAPKVKTEIDLILEKHEFKFEGPKRNHKGAVKEILKTITADELDKFLAQLTTPLWPPRMVAEAIRWSAVTLIQPHQQAPKMVMPARKTTAP
jgi:hypothetical protein